MGRPEKTDCVHHWYINSRNFGVCKKCGARRHFDNVTMPTLQEMRKLQREIRAEAKKQGWAYGN